MRTFFEMTEHATKRMQQRGRRPAEIEFVLQHGTDTERGFLLTEEDAQRIEADAKKAIEFARRLRGIFVPCDRGIVKTVFKSTRHQQRRLLKR